MLQVVRFDPSDCRFPPPRVPVRAGLAPAALRPPLPALPPGGPASRRFLHFRRARYALKAACRLAGVGPGAALLAPAYHCRTMLDAALSLGAGLRLYRVDDELAPHLADVERALDTGAEPARALLVPHYFGFPQRPDRMAALRALCDAHGVALIEDCSHAMVLDPGLCAAAGPTPAIGGNAHIGVSSPYKFIPARDGGLLWFDDDAGVPPAPPRRPGWRDEWRAGLDLLREAMQRETPPAAQAAAVHTPGPAGRDLIEDGRRPSRHYDDAESDLAALASTRWIMARADAAAIAAARRRHYLRWADAAAEFPGARALMPVLTEATVPYMFPLLLDQPERSFHRLKSAGLPIWRWDEMVRSDCPVAGRYRKALLHLPCHQGLTEQQLDWMIATVATVMARTGGGVSAR